MPLKEVFALAKIWGNFARISLLTAVMSCLPLGQNPKDFELRGSAKITQKDVGKKEALVTLSNVF